MSKTSQANKMKSALGGKTKTADVEVQAPVAEQKADVETQDLASTETPTTESTVTRVAKVRSKRYTAAKKLVDVDKLYALSDAIELVKKTSLSKFEGKIEAHVTTTDIGNIGEIAFPHLETASKKVVILNDTILAEIKEGKVNFDILIATPITMPKLLPFARVLGPKGLMPNPKNGTLTDKPEDAVKKLGAAKTMVKTEKKAPVVHIIVGKVSQPEKEISANVAELIKVIKAPKIKKLALCATMGPSVKVKVEITK